MTDLKYIVNPYLMNDEEESVKEDKPENNGMLMKKMEKLFFEKRTVYLWGVVDDKSAKEVVNKLLLLDADKPGAEIKFYINSPGGVVTSGMVMYDTMKLIQSPVSTICMGLAASMGQILLCAGVKGKRTALKHSRIMMHQPSGAIGGQATDIEITAREIKKLRTELYAITAHHTGKDEATIAKDSDRDFWMTAADAKEYGLVDEVLLTNPRKENKL